MITDAEMLNQVLVTVRKFVNERLIPCEQQVADTDSIPPELVDEMKELGLFGMSIPEAYGGLGFTMEEEVRVMFELGRAAPAFRSIFATNVGIGSQGIISATICRNWHRERSSAHSP